MNLDDALDRLRDGSLDAAGQEALGQLLRAKPEARRQLRQRLVMDGALHDLLRPGPPQRLPRPRSEYATRPRARSRTRPQRRRWPAVFAVAAVLLSAVLVGSLLLRDSLPGEPSGPQAIPETIGFIVHDGKWTLSDGSSLDLRGRVIRRGPQHLHLDMGQVTIDAQSQAATAPLEISTDHGRVRVVGTRFRVAREGEITFVAVDSGAVEVLDLRGGRRQLSHGQELRLGTEGFPPEPPATPPATTSQTWSVDLAALTDTQDWFAEAASGGLAGRHDHETEARTNMPTWRVGVPERWDETGYGAVGPDLVVEAEFSLDEPRWVVLVLGCWEQDPAQRWRANLQHTDEFAAGRHRLRVTWADLVSVAGDDPAAAVGAILRQISVVSGGAGDPGLVVHRITVCHTRDDRP